MKLENLKKPHIIILAVCAVLALISVIFTGVRLYKINFLDSELEKLYAKEEEYENQALWDEYDALSEAADDAEFAYDNAVDYGDELQSYIDDYDVFEEDEEDDEEDDQDEVVPDPKDLTKVNLNDYDDTDEDDEDDVDVEDDSDIEDDTDVDDVEDDTDSEDQDPNMPSGVLDYDDEGWWDLEGEYHWLEEEGTPSWWGTVSHDEED